MNMRVLRGLEVRSNQHVGGMPSIKTDFLFPPLPQLLGQLSPSQPGRRSSSPPAGSRLTHQCLSRFP